VGSGCADSTRVDWLRKSVKTLVDSLQDLTLKQLPCLSSLDSLGSAQHSSPVPQATLQTAATKGGGILQSFPAGSAHVPAGIVLVQALDKSRVITCFFLLKN